LLLKRREPVIPSLTLLREGYVRSGESIGLAGYGESNLWLEISLTPTLLGRIKQILYKPGPVWLIMDRGSAKSHATFRAPAPMMATGFLASPLLLRNEDVLAMHRGTNITRPKSYELSLDRGDAI